MAARVSALRILRGISMRFLNAPLLPVSLIVAIAGLAQTFPTIPESLARANTSLTRGTTIPSGSGPTLDSLLTDTDVIVRGVVGAPRSYLSDDQRAVLTDYPLLNASILYERRGLASAPDQAAQTLAVTLLGGEIEINGLKFSDRPGALPALVRGSEHLLCLKVEEGKLLVALSYFGAFAVGEDHLAPLTPKDGFAPEVRRLPTEQMIAAFKSRAEALHVQGPRRP